MLMIVKQYRIDSLETLVSLADLKSQLQLSLKDFTMISLLKVNETHRIVCNVNDRDDNIDITRVS